MKKSFDEHKKKEFTREAIIGLGEESIRKNYYPELQDRLLELEKTNSRNRALMTAIPDILLVSDTQGHISPISISKNNSNTMVMQFLRNRELIKIFGEYVEKVIEKRELLHYHFTFPTNKKTGYYEARIHISDFDEVLIIIRDITEQVLLEQQLRDLAEKDALTQAYNRHFFEKNLAVYNKKDFEHISIVIVDIDGLKLINDTLGHIVGDQLIVTAASLVTSVFKSIGLVSRIGGDEFGIFITHHTIETIETALVDLQSLVSDYNQSLESIKLSLSFGYAYHEVGELSIDWLYQEADNNMYQNKLLKTSSIKNNLVKTLMKTLEAKDYITEGHADRMDILALQIGKYLKLTQTVIDRIQLLTKFHDIGKVGIPDAILKKAGPLTTDEWKVMRTHSQIGERIANESSELKDIAHLILKHHERFDGTGYPLGLTGLDIPIECRILSIVDAYDAMTNDRPYRKAMSTQEAIAEIVLHSGTQFDPKIVHTFTQIIHAT